MIRKKLITAVFMVVFTFPVMGCNLETQPVDKSSTVPQGPTSTPPQTANIKNLLDIQHYPRVDGSTSAHPLQVAVACHVLSVTCTWQEGDFLSTMRRLAPQPLAADAEGRAEMIRQIYHSGTHQAYVNLIEGGSDLILVARAPSEDELRLAEREGVELELHAIALDAFVFLLHRGNPVDDLSLDQVRQIYSGEITTWAEVGGAAQEIHTYQRNRNSGSQELMERLVMRGLPMKDSPDMILESMMGPINAISDDALGIGYSVYFYAEFISPHAEVKLSGIDGVHPNSDSIKSRAYPLTTEVYAVVRSNTPTEAPARALLHWLLTPEGQEVVRGSGYVPLGIAE